jgi:hypothetical protein
VTERDAGTHGVAGGPNPCVNGYLDAYLLEGRLPARRAACAPHPEPTPKPKLKTKGSSRKAAVGPAR